MTNQNDISATNVSPTNSHVCVPVQCAQHPIIWLYIWIYFSNQSAQNESDESAEEDESTTSDSETTPSPDRDYDEASSDASEEAETYKVCDNITLVKDLSPESNATDTEEDLVLHPISSKTKEFENGSRKSSTSITKVNENAVNSLISSSSPSSQNCTKPKTALNNLSNLSNLCTQFSRSSVGGSKYLMNAHPSPPDANDLVFESRFESGNLAKAIKVTPVYYELYLRSDMYTSRHSQWFYFRVTNTRKNVPYRWVIFVDYIFFYS